MSSDIDLILSEDSRRMKALQRLWHDYNPITGRGSLIERVSVTTPFEPEEVRLPATMTADPDWGKITDPSDYNQLRFRHDFEYWCEKCVRIRHKITGRIVPFTLNAPQRRVLAIMENMRLNNKPIRLIMLKARQWGGSTLVQMYFAWIQIIHLTNWNSLICAHVNSSAANIRDMYYDMLASYPADMQSGDKPLALKPCRDSRGKHELVGRGCRIALGTSNSPDALRGLDCSMAHLTEVAFWLNTPRRKSADFLRTITSTVPYSPMTAVVIESTANGMGNYFHSEWKKARDGRSAYTGVFVPWYEIDLYRQPFESPLERVTLASTLSDYEKMLWKKGVSLEQINWYRTSSKNYADPSGIKAEFPTDDIEAFVNTGFGVFAPEHLDTLAKTCTDPAFVGEVEGKTFTGHDAIRNVEFKADSTGRLKIWQMPSSGRNRYVVSVDIGGRSLKSDWSVICVFDRYPSSGLFPEVVAQWRGHADHDIIGWKAAAIARFYSDALLIIESNTLESGGNCDPSLYILGELRRAYPNLYVRTTIDKLHPTLDSRPGFHTNRRTKQAAVTNLIASVRDGLYIERDKHAVEEMAVFQQTPSGGYSAAQGHHDDIVMTRAIGLYVISQLPPARFPSLPEITLTSPAW